MISGGDALRKGLGSLGQSGCMSAQWGFHSAPCLIHFSNNAFSLAINFLLDSGGGMWKSGSVEESLFGISGRLTGSAEGPTGSRKRLVFPHLKIKRQILCIHRCSSSHLYFNLADGHGRGRHVQHESVLSEASRCQLKL